VAVYFQCKFASFCDIVWRKFALLFAVQLSATSRLANNERCNAQVLTTLQVDKDSNENEFDDLKPRICEVDEELDRKQDTVQEYFRNLGAYILWQMKVNQSIEIVPFGYVVLATKRLCK